MSLNIIPRRRQLNYPPVTVGKNKAGLLIIFSPKVLEACPFLEVGEKVLAYTEEENPHVVVIKPDTVHDTHRRIMRKRSNFVGASCLALPLPCEAKKRFSASHELTDEGFIRVDLTEY